MSCDIITINNYTFEVRKTALRDTDLRMFVCGLCTKESK